MAAPFTSLTPNIFLSCGQFFLESHSVIVYHTEVYYNWTLSIYICMYCKKKKLENLMQTKVTFSVLKGLFFM